MGSQFLSIVPERTGSPMLTPVRGSHKGTEVHCPNAQRDARQSSPASRPEYRYRSRRRLQLSRFVVVKAKTQQYANANAPRTSVAHRDPHPDKTVRR
jgi:hypothetical protein